MNKISNKKIVIIVLVIALVAAGLIIAAVFCGFGAPDCTGKNCWNTKKQQGDSSMPFSKGPTSPPQVGTPNIPLPK